MRKMKMVAWWVARRGVGGGCSGEQPYTGGRYCSYYSSVAFVLI